LPSRSRFTRHRLRSCRSRFLETHGSPDAGERSIKSAIYLQHVDVHNKEEYKSNRSARSREEPASFVAFGRGPENMVLANQQVGSKWAH
jgi:hypothetical protein